MLLDVAIPERVLPLLSPAQRKAYLTSARFSVECRGTKSQRQLIITRRVCEAFTEAVEPREALVVHASCADDADFERRLRAAWAATAEGGETAAVVVVLDLRHVTLDQVNGVRYMVDALHSEQPRSVVVVLQLTAFSDIVSYETMYEAEWRVKFVDSLGDEDRLLLWLRFAYKTETVGREELLHSLAVRLFVVGDGSPSHALTDSGVLNHKLDGVRSIAMIALERFLPNKDEVRKIAKRIRITVARQRQELCLLPLSQVLEVEVFALLTAFLCHSVSRVLQCGGHVEGTLRAGADKLLVKGLKVVVPPPHLSTTVRATAQLLDEGGFPFFQEVYDCLQACVAAVYPSELSKAQVEAVLEEYDQRAEVIRELKVMAGVVLKEKRTDPIVRAYIRNFVATNPYSTEDPVEDLPNGPVIVMLHLTAYQRKPSSPRQEEEEAESEPAHHKAMLSHLIFHTLPYDLLQYLKELLGHVVQTDTRSTVAAVLRNASIPPDVRDFITSSSSLEKVVKTLDKQLAHRSHPFYNFPLELKEELTPSLGDALREALEAMSTAAIRQVCVRLLHQRGKAEDFVSRQRSRQTDLQCLLRGGRGDGSVYDALNVRDRRGRGLCVSHYVAVLKELIGEMTSWDWSDASPCIKVREWAGGDNGAAGGGGSAGDCWCALLESAPQPQRSRRAKERSEALIRWDKVKYCVACGFRTLCEGITSDGRIVAVKVQEMLSSEEVSDANRVVEEIELMRHLQHRNIVSYYGWQSTPLESGAVMLEIFLEMCHGGDLSSVLEEKQCIPISLVRTYVRGVLEGLKYLHGNQIVHRDLKPDNVLIASDGTVKLGSFGCSKLIETTLCHTWAGTPMYTAPEVINASRDGLGYSTSADIWSLGCTMLELLGRQPWKHFENAFALLFRIGNSTGMPEGMPAEDECPPALYDFLSHCLEHDAGSRWTAEQLLQHEWMTCPDAELEVLPAADESMDFTPSPVRVCTVGDEDFPLVVKVFSYSCSSSYTSCD